MRTISMVKFFFVCLSVIVGFFFLSSVFSQPVTNLTNITIPGGEIKEIETFRLADDKYGVAAIYHWFGVDALSYWVIEGDSSNLDDYGKVISGPHGITYYPGENSIQEMDASSHPYTSYTNGYLVWVYGESREYLGLAKVSASGVIWTETVHISEINPSSLTRFLEPTISVDSWESAGVAAFIPSDDWGQRCTVNTWAFRCSDGSYLHQAYLWFDSPYDNFIPEITWDHHAGKHILSFRRIHGFDWDLLNYRVYRWGAIDGTSREKIDTGEIGDDYDPNVIKSLCNYKGYNSDDNIILVTDKKFYWINQDLELVPGDNPKQYLNVKALCMDWTASDQIARTFKSFVRAIGGFFIWGAEQEQWQMTPSDHTDLPSVHYLVPESCTSSHNYADAEIFLAGEAWRSNTIRVVMVQM